jgi:hypothetical protein
MFPGVGFIPMDHCFAKGDHRLLEIPHPSVLRFHGCFVLHRHSHFVVAGRPVGCGGIPDGKGGDDKKNARIGEWNVHREASVRISDIIIPRKGGEL